mmetsp:Transcript_45705/g.112018  ORF Transcript_45705/g.112018 Transcript_45705/m.112018 type:complete len:328 (-) Transcript_45705:97-1080(-)
MATLRKAVAEAKEAVTENVAPRVEQVRRQRYVSAASDFVMRNAHHAARVAVALYFVNLAYTYITYWRYYNVQGIPWASFVMLPCALLVAANVKVHVFATVVMLLAMRDAGAISYHQFYEWWYRGQQLYVNELMVKKFSMAGAVLMVLVHDPFFKTKLDNTRRALEGLITADQPTIKITTRVSIALLVVRLLISSLFLFVGYGEVQRQRRWASGVVHGHGAHQHVHKRPAGDGHDQMWLKVIQALLSLPFAVGFKTRWTARALATALVTEALIYWRWWSTLLSIWYGIHARDHFCVNIGVAGGLVLLQAYGGGGGKFSVDNLMTKKTQ